MFEKAEIPITCGHCGRQTKKTVSWLNSNRTLHCGCGARIDIDASQFSREMKKVEKAVDDFKRSIKRFSR